MKTCFLAEARRKNIFLPQRPQKCAKFKKQNKVLFALLAFFAAKNAVNIFSAPRRYKH